MTEENPVKSKIEQSFLNRTADAALSFWHRLQALWFRWADLNQHNPWFLPLIGLLIYIDAIIVILPGDVILVLAVLSNPAAWKRIWLAGAVGGILGGFTLFLIISSLGAEWIHHFNATLDMHSAWKYGSDMFKHYGLISIAIGSVIPGASWAPVVLAGLTGSSPLWVLVFLSIGRTARYFIFCAGTREGWAIMHTIREKARQEKERILAATAKTDNHNEDAEPPSSIQ